MAVSEKTVMAMKSYQNQAGVLVNNYLLADSFIPYTSILGGILACKLVYDLSRLINNFHFKSYSGLTKIQRIEWDNRGMSTVHAIFISVMSLYFVFWSPLYSDHRLDGVVTFRQSPLSTFVLGVSVGYFLADLGMILWMYPSLGGVEYVVHHSLSGIAVAYAMLSGEGQVYTYMVLISEVTTPEINMRWYLDTAGMKKSIAYLINGVVIFLAWLVASLMVLFGGHLHSSTHRSWSPWRSSRVHLRSSTHRSWSPWRYSMGHLQGKFWRFYGIIIDRHLWVLQQKRDSCSLGLYCLILAIFLVLINPGVGSGFLLYPGVKSGDIVPCVLFELNCLMCVFESYSLGSINAISYGNASPIWQINSAVADFNRVARDSPEWCFNKILVIDLILACYALYIALLLVARILMFAYMFYHVYLHFEQVNQMHWFGLLLVFVVPSVLLAMNLMWFWKIIKGLMKTLSKKL